MKIFVAYGFSTDADKELANHVQTLVQAHGLTVTTGEHLDGGQLTEAVMERIRESDGLVALMTRDEQRDGRWFTHEWVSQELSYARGRELRSVALFEDGIVPEGMHASHRWIPYEPDRPLPAFADLADVIGSWKRREGRTLVAKLRPDEAGEAAAAPGATVRYRFFSKGDYAGWRDGEIVRKPGAILAYLPGADEDSEVEVEIRGVGSTWRSVVEPQWLQLKLEQA